MVVKNAPTTAISDVMSSRRISVSLIWRLRNKRFTTLSVGTARRGAACPHREKN